LNPRLLHLFLQGRICQKAAGALLRGELDRDDDVVRIVERSVEPMSRRTMPDSDEPSLLLRRSLRPAPDSEAAIGRGRTFAGNGPRLYVVTAGESAASAAVRGRSRATPRLARR
jgi:hypothetical protein